MHCLGKAIGFALLFRGVLLLGWPRKAIHFWSGEHAPEWIRKLVQLWEPLSDDALRLLGINQLFLGGLILKLTERARA